MKTVLIVCDQPNIDVSLRRSLAHLVKSCQVTKVADGYRAFDELNTKIFDLIIIDSQIEGIDSLELVESVDYIDPGIPVILMLDQTHKTLWGTARSLKAHPILRPFKPLTFLRLIDTQLHEHLERYRELAENLKSILEGLSVPTQAPITFLIDETGQPLISAGEFESELLESLGNLAVSKVKLNGHFLHNLKPQDIRWLAENPSEKDHELYLASVIDKLYLALVFPITATHLTATDIWQWIDLTAKEIKQAFYANTPLDESHLKMQETPQPNSQPSNQDTQHRILIPLRLNTSETPSQELTEQSSASVNWQILAESPTLLNRLEQFCQVD